MGSMTQGVQAGIAAYQNSVRLKQLKELQAHQMKLGGIETLNKLLGIKNKKQRKIMLDQYGEDIERMTGRPIAPAVLEMLKASEDEEVGTLRSVFSQLGLDSDPAQLMEVMGDPYKALDYAIKFQNTKQKGAQDKEAASIFGKRLPGEEGDAPPATPQPPKDFTLRTGPAGEAFGMEPSPPLQEQGDPLLQQAAPAAPAPPSSVEDRVALLDRQGAGLVDMVRQAEAAGIPFTPERQQAVKVRKDEIDRQRAALLPKGVLTEVAGPGGVTQRTMVDPHKLGPVGNVPHTRQTEVGKLEADLRDLQANGQGEDSPAGRAIKAQIEQTRTAKDPAQSPMGKMVDDLERAKRMYGPNSPQAAAVAESIQQASKGEGPKAADVNTMRGQFSSLSQSFREVSDAYGRIKSVTKEPSQAGDIAMLTSFMKMIDPTTGVKEGEFLIASNAGTIPERIRSTYNRLLSEKDGRLSDSIRKDYMNQAKNVYQGHERKHRALEKQYESMAKNQGFNPSDVVVSFVVPEDADDLPNGSSAPKDPLPSANNAVKRATEALEKANKLYIDTLNDWVKPKRPKK